MNGNRDDFSRTEWVAPVLVELSLGMVDVAAGGDPGTDGDSPGSPDTSQS